ncbi:hypothetical protein H8D57_00695, partial [bacterium]|nr:hypothetical protein [bacterium]
MSNSKKTSNSVSKWKKEFNKTKLRDDTLFKTISSADVPVIVTQDDMEDWNPEEKLSMP